MFRHPETLIDTEEGLEFIISEHGRDPKSQNFRSPHTNKYFPTHQEDMFMLSPLLRDLEEKGNLLFSEYARLYYGEDGCVATFYVFETEEGLNFALYIRKSIPSTTQPTRTMSVTASGLPLTSSKSGGTPPRVSATGSKQLSSTN